MSFKDLVAALDAEPSPCEKYQCERREACGQRKEACISFLHYVSTGEALHPLLSRFESLRNGRPHRAIYGDEIQASRKIFDRLDHEQHHLKEWTADDEVALAILNRDDLDMTFSAKV